MGLKTFYEIVNILSLYYLMELMLNYYFISIVGIPLVIISTAVTLGEGIGANI